MLGFCKNGKNISIFDLYLINDWRCFDLQIAHIKRYFSYEIGECKTGFLLKQKGGNMIMYLFKFDGLHVISDICM